VPIKAVIWDMGGVILRTEDRSHRRQWEQHLELKDGRLDSIVFEGRASQLASVGKADEEQIWAEVGESLRLSEAELADLKIDFWRGDVVDQDLVKYIRQLRSELQTALLSNAWPNVRSYIEGKGDFADAFDEIVISAEVGLVKPDPRIYALTLEALAVQPETAVFVDDSLENVEAARTLGLEGILFRSPTQAMGEVNRLLVPAA
jgi:putative hydrolase of the HAD superfamily